MTTDYSLLGLLLLSLATPITLTASSPSPPFTWFTWTGKRHRSSWNPADEGPSATTSSPSIGTSGSQDKPAANGRRRKPPLDKQKKPSQNRPLVIKLHQSQRN